MVKIATWNVNSVRTRADHLARIKADGGYDLILLQELKCTEDALPAGLLTDGGWHASISGQKAYNGVAILSRTAPDAVRVGLPGDDGDLQARYVEADFGPLLVACLYLPNGNPVPGDKFAYKLDWMRRLEARMAQVLATRRPAVFAGDYNVIPEARDAYDPADFAADAVYRPESRAAFRRLLHMGYTDAIRATTLSRHVYSYWDYQKGRWDRDQGIRIDHLLLSPEAADRLEAAGVDRAPRSWDKASDHTAVWAQLKAA